MGNKTNSDGYILTDRIVGDALNHFDDSAEEAGVEYALGGGFAAQSYIVEGIAEKHGVEVEELNTKDVGSYLRNTGDLDIPVKAESNEIAELKGNLFSRGWGGELEPKSDTKYTGELERFTGGEHEGIDLNIFNNEAKGFSEDQYNAQLENSSRYENGNISFNRIGLENLIWAKIKGSLSGRSGKDLADVAYLMRLQGDNIDEDYMNDLIEEDEVEDRYELVKDEEWQNQVFQEIYPPSQYEFE